MKVRKKNLPKGVKKMFALEKGIKVKYIASDKPITNKKKRSK